MNTNVVDKKQLSETDICTKYITPSIVASKWDIHTQISEQKTFTSGKVKIDDNGVYREEVKRYDYLLSYLGIPLAIVEAKDNKHTMYDGMQQAIEYAEILDVPFVYSTNGDGFIEHDRTISTGDIERELNLEEFPKPQELWDRYKYYKKLDKEKEDLLTCEYYVDDSGKQPRYYQRIAINRTMEAIANGENRILLVMATGSGKTYVASQIIWKLWKSKNKKRILFLADRNILVDQTMTNDFKQFGKKMTKITNRKVDKSYEIYLALYQGISGNESYKNIYKEFSKDFFDLIIVDECHRGSAEEDSNWREILEYFETATQIGLTATPKETKTASNTEYFGEPLYTYSLKQGIEDGFLAPYKVIQVDIEAELDNEENNLDMKDGKIEKEIVIDGRTQFIAKYVTNYLKQNDRFSKTIIFCEDTDHAARMRSAMINENSDLYSKNRKYIMRITGNDDKGKLELDNFIDPSEKYPTIVTTSKLLSTGVDAQTCNLIIIDKKVSDINTFKQMIGRGTRINESYGKYFFTIIDFRGVTEWFHDPLFDGDPIVRKKLTIKGKGNEVSIHDKDTSTTPGRILQSKSNNKEKKYIKGAILGISREEVKFFDGKGKVITSDFNKYIKDKINNKYENRETLLNDWINEKNRKCIINNIFDDINIYNRMQEEYSVHYDMYDVLCNIGFDMELISRKERVIRLEVDQYLDKYSEDIREILDILIDKYIQSGVDNIDNIEVLRVKPFDNIGSPIQIVQKFGGINKYKDVIYELKKELYK